MDKSGSDSQWASVFKILEALGKGDFSARISLPGERTDFEELGKKLNQLAAQLDATTQQALEEQEKKFKKRIIRQFLNNLDHEIRTPVNSILGFSRLIMVQDVPKETKDYGFSIYDSAESLLGIFNDMLDFARLEEGEFSLEHKAFNLLETLTNCEHTFAPKIEKKGLELRFVTDPNLPQAMVGDQKRISQLISNLVDNGIKFTERGSVTIETSLLELKDAKANIQIVVKDTGVGIPPEKLDPIFQGFTQAQANDDRSFGGTGLGLSICHRILTIMGGEICVDSIEGHGSSFSMEFELPLGKKEDVETRPSIPTFPEDLNGLNVLMVEDNRNNQILGKKVLEEMQINVTIASDGKEALDRIQFEFFDLILMDIQMPEMDGVEATKLIRGLPGSKGQVPIIAVTAHAFRNQVEYYKEVGMNDYVAKPFQPQILYAAIEKNLSSKKQKEDGNTPNHDAKENSEVIDLSNLKDLAAGDLNFLDEMIQVFLEDVPEHFDNLENALKTCDWAQLKYLAHKLKGPIDLMGIKNGSTILNRLEFYDFDEPDLNTLQKEVERIGELCEKAAAELREELNKYN